MEELVNIFGYVILWTAINVGREKSVELFTKNWFIIIILILISIFLIEYK